MATGVKVTRRKTPGVAAVARVVRGFKAEEVANIAKALERRARELAPVRTGFLRDSIVAYEVRPGTWHVDARAPYAAYVEYGTRYMHAQPFMTPASVEVVGQTPAITRETWHDSFSRNRGVSVVTSR